MPLRGQALAVAQELVDRLHQEGDQAARARGRGARPRPRPRAGRSASARTGGPGAWQDSTEGIRPTQPARITSVNSIPPRPWNTAMRPRGQLDQRPGLDRRALGLEQLHVRVLAAQPVEPGAGEADADVLRRVLDRDRQGRGVGDRAEEVDQLVLGDRLRRSGAAAGSPRRRRARRRRARSAICSAGVAPNTVIASGRRPPRSSAAHAITCRRSSGVSFLTSVPRPSAAMPWTPLATQCSTCARIAPRSSRPAASKNA